MAITAGMRFSEFLSWSRNYIKEHGIESYKEVFTKLKQSVTMCNLEHCRDCGETSVFKGIGPSGTRTLKRSFDYSEGLACTNCSACEKCCECVECGACSRNRNSDFFCSSCEYCTEGCCECAFCNSCESQISSSSFCYDCENCHDCCSCEDGRPNVKFINNPVHFHKCSKVNHKTNPSRRFIAAEIEIAKIGPNNSVTDVMRKWQGCIVHDGSLPSSGFEINTAPANGDLFIKQINEIGAELKRGEAEITDDCGLHVHIDARDLKYYELRRLIKTYSTIESALFGMVPSSRKESHYCMPCGRKYMQEIVDLGKAPYKKVRKDVIRGTYLSENTKDQRTDKYAPARYNALNIHSWFYRGTIECRLFNGTANPEKIANWGMLWAMILDYVVKASDDQVDGMVNNIPLDNLLMIADNNQSVKDFINKRFAKYGKAVFQTTQGL